MLRFCNRLTKRGLTYRQVSHIFGMVRRFLMVSLSVSFAIYFWRNAKVSQISDFNNLSRLNCVGFWHDNLTTLAVQYCSDFNLRVLFSTEKHNFLSTFVEKISRSFFMCIFRVSYYFDIVRFQDFYTLINYKYFWNLFFQLTKNGYPLKSKESLTIGRNFVWKSRYEIQDMK